MNIKSVALGSTPITLLFRKGCKYQSINKVDSYVCINLFKITLLCSAYCFHFYTRLTLNIRIYNNVIIPWFAMTFVHLLIYYLALY